jgi:hypothetical protein
MYFQGQDALSENTRYQEIIRRLDTLRDEVAALRR